MLLDAGAAEVQQLEEALRGRRVPSAKELADLRAAK